MPQRRMRLMPLQRQRPVRRRREDTKTETMKNHAISGRFFTALRLRSLIISIMTAAFIFGFMKAATSYNFDRLHVFLFNMTTGGFIILYYTEGGERPSRKSLLYLALRIVFS